jgi:hypothetical protein
VKHGMISQDDLNLFQFVDTPQDAFTALKDGLTEYYLKPGAEHYVPHGDGPDIAKTNVK